MEPDDAQPTEAPAGSPSQRILIMEDEEIIRELLSDFLTNQGYEVVLAASGEEGLELYRTQPFAIVLADYGLPGINGIDACRRIAAMDPWSRKILITGWGSIDAAEREPCIDRVIAKPFDLIAVLSTLRELVPST